MELFTIHNYVIYINNVLVATSDTEDGINSYWNIIINDFIRKYKEGNYEEWYEIKIVDIDKNCTLKQTIIQ